MSALLWLNPRVAIFALDIGDVDKLAAFAGPEVEVACQMRNLLRDDCDDVLVQARAELCRGGLIRRMR